VRPSLSTWVSDADAFRHVEQFGLPQVPFTLAYLRARTDDYYLALVGELFDRMRNWYDDATQWARLGNALAHFAAADREQELRAIGVATN